MGFQEAVATDISDDALTALGFAGKLIKHTGRHFDRIICDGAYLPFVEEQFDVVFMCSTYHHIREKQKLADEVYRVLKPGGVFVGMGDNPRHPNRTIEDALGPVKREREKFNINETQPTVEEYYGYLDNARFSDYYFYPFDENLLKENWDFDKDNMIVRILLDASKKHIHSKTVSLLKSLSKRTQLMFNLERFIMLNYWAWIPNNVVMVAIK